MWRPPATLGYFLGFCMLLLHAISSESRPELYRQPSNESPVRGAPDDLLLLAGLGLADGDAVVYRSIADTTATLSAPEQVPETSSPDLGVAPVVSTKDAPYSLTVRLPEILRVGMSYALWVHTDSGEWSNPVMINDARPLWFSPTTVHATSASDFLPREIKVIGRNLDPVAGRSTLVRLSGPENFTAPAITERTRADDQIVGQYVVRVRLPRHLAPGHYRVSLSRDGIGWIDIKGQSLEVLQDLRPPSRYSVSDPKFGGCRPDDGLDDTVCIVRAISAAARGGVVYFDAGTWDLIDPHQDGVIGNEGMLVPEGVQLQGAGSTATRLNRHPSWNTPTPTAGFTLLGQTSVSGFTFHDLQIYRPGDRAGPYLQLGKRWDRPISATERASGRRSVSDVAISRNVFDKPLIAIGAGGVPIVRLTLTHNIFGAYHAALELTGDSYNNEFPFRLDDSIIDYNIFKPGSELDVINKSGAIASEIGAGHRVDFSNNMADGASLDYLYAPDDPKGWRAAFFWSSTNNVEEVLVSRNTATCTGDKIGDGEAIAFDSNTNTFAFAELPTVSWADESSIIVSAPLISRQHDRDVPVDSYYVGHWVQIVSGPGLGQTRKIIGYSTDATTHSTKIRVAPDWDVVPISGSTRVSVGREYWQLYVVGNQVDNRRPLCGKSNRSRRAGGAVGLWAQTADTVFAGNRQFDSDGIFAQQNSGFVTQDYHPIEHPCAGCTTMGFFNFFLEIRDNIIDGEYDWEDDCSRSGIGLGVAAAPWTGAPPPTVGFGVSIAHNTIRRADEQYGGAIAQVNTWYAGPPPNRWPLSDNALIHHNSISSIDGARARAICGPTHARMGITFPDAPIAWRTVLYANSCKDVSTPIGSGGIDTVKVCPSSTSDSCECPR
jgi:hypothetical protein